MYEYKHGINSIKYKTDGVAKKLQTESAENEFGSLNLD